MKPKRPGPTKETAVDAGPTLRELVGPVEPLRPAAKRISPLTPRRAPPDGPAASGATLAYSFPPRGHGSRETPAFDVEDDGTFIEGVRSGQEAALRDLARGRVPAVATFDLHGFTAAEAERKLHRFLEQHRGSRRRAVLVVHGRGHHSAGGRGVLRDQIAAWLSSAPFAEMVLCFATARPRDGGGGALYVLLSPRG